VDGHPDPSDAHVRFVDRLTAEEARELRALGARRRVPPGSILFLEGDDPHDVVLLETGDVRVHVTGFQGHDVVLDVVGEGDLLGELSAIDGHPRSASATALNHVELTAITSIAFVDYLEQRPRLMRTLLETTIGRLRTSNRRQLEYGTADALGRVCTRLLQLADRFGVPTGDRGTLVEAPLTQTELAQWCGLSREAVVKCLRSLRTLGWIDSVGSTITVLDRVELERRSQH
jgi:CRP/FNR family transcriptional regulator, cyclic AMP receptor protein